MSDLRKHYKALADGDLYDLGGLVCDYGIATGFATIEDGNIRVTNLPRLRQVEGYARGLMAGLVRDGVLELAGRSPAAGRMPAFRIKDQKQVNEICDELELAEAAGFTSPRGVLARRDWLVRLLAACVAEAEAGGGDAR